ncbi:MAG: acyl-CoA thioesterase [Bacteroidales bacterium]|nr:acyl-CoA thioesterase [Bacteroidales bacterium]
MQVLSDTVHIKVRFSEVDSMNIVWHGAYVKYLEDGRESFGKKYGITYQDVLESGYYIPIVKLNCVYQLPLRYGDSAIVETRFINSDAAKILFDYSIYRESDQALILEASSMQVFLNQQQELELNTPPFFADWKKKHLAFL